MPIRISRRASASSTAFSIRTLTSCKSQIEAETKRKGENERHADMDLSSGSVCLDVINQTWSPMFDMINIFEVFLPQLLRYPNPTDPLNGEAAALLIREPKSYEAKVKGVWFAAVYHPPTRSTLLTNTDRVCAEICKQRCRRRSRSRKRRRRRHVLGSQLWGRRRRRACWSDGRRITGRIRNNAFKYLPWHTHLRCCCRNIWYKGVYGALFSI